MLQTRRAVDNHACLIEILDPFYFEMYTLQLCMTIFQRILNVFFSPIFPENNANSSCDVHCGCCDSIFTFGVVNGATLHGSRPAHAHYVVYSGRQGQITHHLREGNRLHVRVYDNHCNIVIKFKFVMLQNSSFPFIARCLIG